MFDFAIAIESYYFWQDIVNDLKEIKRILKQGAFLLLVHAAYKDEKFEKRNNKIEKIDYLPEKNWICIVAQKSKS